MKTFMIAATMALTATAAATSASAQGYDRYDRGYDRSDRDYDRDRNENRGERAAREIFRGVTGRGSECRYVVSRHRDRDGDLVETRRRICD